jgi:hypothetical protein
VEWGVKKAMTVKSSSIAGKQRRDWNIPGFLARSFTKDIPTLGRWAKQ